MKMIKHIVALVGLAALLAGCATDNQGSGAMGNDSENGYGSSATTTNALPYTPATAPVPTGPNGSVSRTNPFGEQ
jgi:hypothetical protein